MIKPADAQSCHATVIYAPQINLNDYSPLNI